MFEIKHLIHVIHVIKDQFELMSIGIGERFWPKP